MAELIYTFNDYKNIGYKLYIQNLVTEATIFADKGFFSTPSEDIEKRVERQTLILSELNQI